MTRRPTKDARSYTIWIVSREFDGLAGAGGVKDVTSQLAHALTAQGNEVHVVLPRYGFMAAADLGFRRLDVTLTVDMSYPANRRQEDLQIWRRALGAHGAIYLLESSRFAEKQDVYTYSAAEEEADPRHRQGEGHEDYFAMNVLHQKGTLGLIMRLKAAPDIIHCHDGHTALIPALICEQDGFRHYFHDTGCVVTIHNAGHGYHQEVADLPYAQAITGLPLDIIKASLLNSAFDPLLAASSYAVMNTVSENYARELRETYRDELTGWLGHRLMARGIRLEGITNGIDPAAFDTRHPEVLGLAAPYRAATGDVAGKRLCRRDFLARIASRGLASVRQEGHLALDESMPLFTFIGRFAPQKGIDLLIEAAAALLREDKGFGLLLLGSGPKAIENELARLATAKENEGRVCALIGYDQTIANNVYAAGDFFLIPSLFEPCGLTDYIAQLFGNIPVVHHVGGLVKVVDGVTGLAFSEPTSAALSQAMARALALFRTDPRAIVALRKNGVAQIRRHYTWDKVVAHYFLLYQQALALPHK